MPQRLGIMGGTFDPVHFGHLRAAEEALEAFGFDHLIFMPAADPPHKSNHRITLFKHRWEMLQSAAEDNPRFRLSDLEQTLPGKSYTVVTLNKLLKSFPKKTELYFLVGLDSFLEMHTWWHYRELFQLARFVVLRRPGFLEEEMQDFLRQRVSSRYEWDEEAALYRHPDLFPIHLLANTYFGIASTQIRQLLSQGKSIRYLVPTQVMRYIEEKKLYSDQ
ncbi:MAG: nicotinate-nucleotide adenylyltransferase [Desulforhabdus sp.]|jgi:nicotinate-nucleotide adenylyltransferase|nr:nicotinate-nucleotide adenylyltransferase [Desulforhabdus sp.]